MLDGILNSQKPLEITGFCGNQVSFQHANKNKKNKIMRLWNPRPDPGDRPPKNTESATRTTVAEICRSSLIASTLMMAGMQASASEATNTLKLVQSDTSLQLAALVQQPVYKNETTQSKAQSPWINANGLTKGARYMFATIANSKSFGVAPERLHIDELSELAGVPKHALQNEVHTIGADNHQIDPASLAKIDTLLSSAFKLLVNDVVNGRVVPGKTQRYWFAEHDKVDAEDWLELLRYRPESIQQIISKLVDQNRSVEPLLREFHRYSEIAKAGGWPQIPEGPTIEPDYDSTRVSVLRSRLVISGEYDPAEEPLASAGVYSAPLQEAVKRFQARHGLLTDGLVGKATLAALNVPVEDRLSQIQVNMERTRWLPLSFGERYIITNIPDYRLRVVDNGETTLTMPVVVGKPKHMTPVFSAEMNHIVVNPTWTVPTSIANKELVPDERANPGQLQSRGFQVLARDGSPVNYDSISWETWNRKNFPYTLRQRPGKRNALGKVKFMFPNKHSIYLHDTAAKRLFAKQTRAFSHGCVRVGQPRELANHLLQQEGWKSKDIDRLFARTKTKRINLKHPRTNHIVYFTSWVDEAGVLQFRNDIYGQDKRVAKALFSEHQQRVALISEFRSLQPVVMADQ